MARIVCQMQGVRTMSDSRLKLRILGISPSGAIYKAVEAVVRDVAAREIIENCMHNQKYAVCPACMQAADVARGHN